jgi:hypothetical protein
MASELALDAGKLTFQRVEFAAAFPQRLHADDVPLQLRLQLAQRAELSGGRNVVFEFVSHVAAQGVPSKMK